MQVNIIPADPLVTFTARASVDITVVPTLNYICINSIYVLEYGLDICSMI